MNCRVITLWILLSLGMVFLSCQYPHYTSVTAAQEAKIEQAVSSVSLNELQSTLESLDGVRNVVTGDIISMAFVKDVETNLRNQLLGYGYTVSLDPVKYDSNGVIYTQNTIWAVQEGTDPELPGVLIMAHWDTVADSPGMDDNASAVAVALEVARVIKAENLSTQRSIWIALTAFEEYGFLGSYQWRVDHPGPWDVVVNMDMVGYTSEVQTELPGSSILGLPSKGDFLAVFSLNSHSELVLDYAKAMETFTPSQPYWASSMPRNIYLMPMLNRLTDADQTPFWVNDEAAIFLTDTANLRNPNYHTPDDTIDTLDLDFMHRVTKGLVAFTLTRAGVE